MPLRMKCPSCRHTLVLDDVFQGAHCRCAHCRSIVAVPAGTKTGVDRPASRPDAPPLASTAARKRRVATRPATPARSASLFRRTSFQVVAAALVLGAGALGIAVWSSASPGRDGTSAGDAVARSNEVPGLAAIDRDKLESRPHAMLAADPLHTYFGVPIKGDTVGYVLDCDASMATYLDDVAFMTQIINRTMSAEGRRFGVVQALARPGGEQALEVSEPSTDLVGAWTTLQGALPGGDTQLVDALAVTEGWYADQIFLVLAKELGDREIALLQQHAMQTRAVTHVIALGRAAEIDLSAIALPTGGRYVAVEDKVFRALVNNYKIAIAKDQQGG